MAAFWSIFFFHACLILLCLLLVFYINIRDDAYLDRHLSTCAIVMIYISLHNMASQGSWDFHFMTKCLTRHQSCILRHNHHQHVSTLLHELNQSSLHLLSKKLSLWLSIQIVESIIIGKMLRKYMPLWFMCCNISFFFFSLCFSLLGFLIVQLSNHEVEFCEFFTCALILTSLYSLKF